jgi:hypothetical protein
MQLIADQPWNSSRRRQLLLNFLQAKMEAEDEQLQLEGVRGMWELSINKPHQAEMQACHLRLLVKHLQSANIEVRNSQRSAHARRASSSICCVSPAEVGVAAAYALAAAAAAAAAQEPVMLGRKLA